MVEESRKSLEIKWDSVALEQWRNILLFYFHQSGSAEYPMLLENNLQNVLKKLCEHPRMGQKTNRRDVFRHVILFYRISPRNPETLEVLCIIDARKYRQPD